ncbi:MAG: hypothetical protein VX028_01245 [Nanoarchaeota archaeon]|nr:hypothetical protein [Nanoarchaeota archaeon]MEC8338998.1 hypothetical protein [Nanoarchaeota archaeon]
MSEEKLGLKDFLVIKDRYQKIIDNPSSKSDEVIRAKSALLVVEENIKRYES